MGRSPDHVASCISGMYMGIEQFEAFDAQRAAALQDYYAFARDNDLFPAYVIINPQADRSKGLTEQGEHVAARICDRDSSDITVKGAKMLGTSAIMANEVFVTTIQPLKPIEEPYARSLGHGEMVAGGGADGKEGRYPAKEGDAYFIRLKYYRWILQWFQRGRASRSGFGGAVQLSQDAAR
jgi:hypothetical protein